MFVGKLSNKTCNGLCLFEREILSRVTLKSHTNGHGVLKSIPRSYFLTYTFTLLLSLHPSVVRRQILEDCFISPHFFFSFDSFFLKTAVMVVIFHEFESFGTIRKHVS